MKNIVVVGLLVFVASVGLFLTFKSKRAIKTILQSNESKVETTDTPYSVELLLTV